MSPVGVTTWRRPIGDSHTNRPGTGWVTLHPAWVFARCARRDSGPRFPAVVWPGGPPRAYGPGVIQIQTGARPGAVESRLDYVSPAMLVRRGGPAVGP